MPGLCAQPLIPTYALMADSKVCHPIVKAVVVWLERHVGEKRDRLWD